MNKSFDPNTVSYLRQADSIYKNGFENEEMKMVFIENFFEEIEGSEVKLSLMKSTCFVLQGFVEVACPKHLLQLIKAYKEELQDSAESQQGCHLVQKTLQRIVLLKKEDPTNTIWSEVDKTIEEIAEILCEDLPTWLKHKYASHVTRSVIETLGGAVFSAEVETTLSTCDQISSLKLFIDIICKMQRQQFVEIITHQSGTPSVSILLRICALRSETLIGSLCGKILKVCDDSTLIILAKDRTGSHLIEQLINSGNDETLKKISAIFTGDKLVELACHPVANFVIQQLIQNERIEFAEIFGVLMSEMGSVVSSGKYGVLIKVAERCCQHSQYQSQFVKALLKTLHCETDERKIFLVPLVVGFLTFEKYFPTSTIDLNKIPLLRNITYHGSLLLQILLKFEKKFVVVKSFLEIPSQHLVALACNASGSHLVDMFFSSEKVRLKRKNSVIEKIKSDLHKIACDKYGSRVLENIWRQSSLKIKVAIAESLAPHDLTNNQWGKHVHRNFALKLFTERNSTWLEQQERFDNKRKLFKQFMPDEPVQKKKKTS